MCLSLKCSIYLKISLSIGVRCIFCLAGKVQGSPTTKGTLRHTVHSSPSISSLVGKRLKFLTRVDINEHIFPLRIMVGDCCKSNHATCFYLKMLWPLYSCGLRMRIHVFMKV